MNRLSILACHLLPSSFLSPFSTSSSLESQESQKSIESQKSQKSNDSSSRFSSSVLRSNGWGYKDTSLLISPDGMVRLTGSRYPFRLDSLDSFFSCSGEIFPFFRIWAESNIGLKVEETTPPKEKIEVAEIVCLYENHDCYEKVAMKNLEKK